MVSPYLNRPVRPLDQVLQARLEAADPGRAAPGAKVPDAAVPAPRPSGPEATPAPRRAA